MQLNNTLMDSSIAKTSHFKELTKAVFCWTCRLPMTRTTSDVLLLQRRQRRAKVLPFIGHAGCRLPELRTSALLEPMTSLSSLLPDLKHLEHGSKRTLASSCHKMHYQLIDIHVNALIICTFVQQ
jgi:hypothetical protein